MCVCVCVCGACVWGGGWGEGEGREGMDGEEEVYVGREREEGVSEERFNCMQAAWGRMVCVRLGRGVRTEEGQ